MIVLKTQSGTNYSPYACTHICQNMNVRLKLWNPLVFLSMEHCHQSVPNIEHTEHVPENGGNMKHQVRCDQPESDDNSDFGRVLTVAGSWYTSHKAYEQCEIWEGCKRKFVSQKCQILHM